MQAAASCGGGGGTVTRDHRVCVPFPGHGDVCAKRCGMSTGLTRTRQRTRMMRSCSRALGRQDSHPSLPLAACAVDVSRAAEVARHGRTRSERRLHPRVLHGHAMAIVVYAAPIAMRWHSGSPLRWPRCRPAPFDVPRDVWAAFLIQHQIQRD
jgi:hypothetical protein